MTIKATVNYHVKSQQSQAFHFDVDGIAGNLLSPELVETPVYVQDLGDGAYPVNFNDDGILFTHSPSSVSHFSNTSDWQTAYETEITELLKHSIHAQEVYVFDHTLRIDDPKATRKPARNVHNDYSSQGAHQRLADLMGTQKAREFQQGHFGFVNIWRPVEHPIITSPLGFIKPSSMQADDWMNIELIYPDREGQILGVAANPNHQWFYQANMQPEDVIIFNIYDNRGRPHLAHSALDIIGQPDSPIPRKSIETRTLVRYI